MVESVENPLLLDNEESWAAGCPWVSTENADSLRMEELPEDRSGLGSNAVVCPVLATIVCEVLICIMRELLSRLLPKDPPGLGGSPVACPMLDIVVRKLLTCNEKVVLFWGKGSDKDACGVPVA